MCSMWPPKLAVLPVVLLASIAVAIPLDCAYNGPAFHNESCQRPLDPVVSITPDNIIAKLPCLNCSTTESLGMGKHIITHEDNALFFNVSLDASRTRVLLNDRPVFPFPFPAVEPPPRFYGPQVRANFSVADLAETFACQTGPCRKRGCFCLENTVGYTGLSYDYSAMETESSARYEKWQITFDAIGANNGYLKDPYMVFNDPAQKMLRITIQKTVLHENSRSRPGTLFGNPQTSKEDYELQLLSIELVDRSYSFPPARDLSVWEKIQFFFGVEIEETAPGHVVYDQREWDYARKGTLKNALLAAWNEWPLGLIAVIVVSVIGGLVVLYGAYRLILFVDWEARGRPGARDGVVYERLLDGEGEDEESRMHVPTIVVEDGDAKPLPVKPLPEKPLPEVPLLDDV